MEGNVQFPHVKIKHNHYSITVTLNVFHSSQKGNTLWGVIQNRRIQPSVAEGVHIDVLWVWVEGYNLSPDRIKYQLVEEGVIGSGESLDVLFRDNEIHLQVLAHLSDHLTGQQKTVKACISNPNTITLMIVLTDDLWVCYQSIPLII